MAKGEGKVRTMTVEVPLVTAEILSIVRQLGVAKSTLEAAEGRKKASAEDVKDAERQIEELVGTLRRGRQLRHVEVFDRFVAAEGTVETVNKFTGDVVMVRAADPDDYELELPFEEAEEPAEAEPPAPERGEPAEDGVDELDDDTAELEAAFEAPGGLDDPPDEPL